MEIILILIAPVIAAVTAVACAFISARLNRRQAWDQSRREERRTASFLNPVPTVCKLAKL